MASKSGKQVNQAPTLLKNRRLVASADIRLPSSLQQDPSLASSKGGVGWSPTPAPPSPAVSLRNSLLARASSACDQARSSPSLPAPTRRISASCSVVNASPVVVCSNRDSIDLARRVLELARLNWDVANRWFTHKGKVIPACPSHVFASEAPSFRAFPVICPATVTIRRVGIATVMGGCDGRCYQWMIAPNSWGRNARLCWQPADVSARRISPLLVPGHASEDVRCCRVQPWEVLHILA